MPTERSVLDMPVPGTRQAPRKFHGRWTEVRPFLDLYERLCQVNNVTGEAKCTSILQYCSLATREVIEGMKAYRDRDWTAMRSEIEKQFNADRAERRYVEQDLARYTAQSRKREVMNIYEFRKYLRGFTAIGGWLSGQNKISERELHSQFWAGLHPRNRESAEARITTLEPQVDRSVPYTIEKVVKAFEYLMDRDHFDARPIVRLKTNLSDNEYSDDSRTELTSDQEDSDDDYPSDVATRGKKRQSRPRRKTKQLSYRERFHTSPEASARDRSPVSRSEARRILQQLKDEEEQARRLDSQDVEISELVQRMSGLELTDHEYNTLYILATTKKPSLVDVLMRPLTHTHHHLDLPHSMLAVAQEGNPSPRPLPVQELPAASNDYSRELGRDLPMARPRGYPNDRDMAQPQPSRYPRNDVPRTYPNSRPSQFQDRSCFGCGETGHMMGECPQITRLFQEKILRRDMQGRLIMRDGRRIPRTMGEPLVRTIESMLPRSNLVMLRQPNAEPLPPPRPIAGYFLAQQNSIPTIVEETEARSAESDEYEEDPYPEEGDAAVFLAPTASKRRKAAEDAHKKDQLKKTVRTPAARNSSGRAQKTRPVDIAEPTHDADMDDAIMEDQPLPKKGPKTMPTGPNSDQSREVPTIRPPRRAMKSQLAREANEDELFKRFMSTHMLVSIEDLLAGHRGLSDRTLTALKPTRDPVPAEVHEAVLAQTAPKPDSLYDPLIRIWVQCGGYNIQAIIDTGSQLNILSYDIWDQYLPLPRNKLEKAEMVDASGNVTAMAGLCPNVDIRYSTIYTTADLYLGTNVPFHLLLGRPWQRRNRVSINEIGGKTYLVFRDKDDKEHLEIEVSGKMGSVLPRGRMAYFFGDGERPATPYPIDSEPSSSESSVNVKKEPADDWPMLPAPESEYPPISDSSTRAPSAAAPIPSTWLSNTPVPVLTPLELGLVYPTLPKYHYWGTLRVSLGNLPVTALVNLIEPQTYIHKRVWARTNTLLDRSYTLTDELLPTTFEGRATNIPMVVEHEAQQLDALVSGTLSVDLLLGRDWLRSNAIEYDLSQQAIVMKVTGCPRVPLSFETGELNAISVQPLSDDDLIYYTAREIESPQANLEDDMIMNVPETLEGLSFVPDVSASPEVVPSSEPGEEEIAPFADITSLDNIPDSPSTHNFDPATESSQALQNFNIDIDFESFQPNRGERTLYSPSTQRSLTPLYPPSPDPTDASGGELPPFCGIAQVWAMTYAPFPISALVNAKASVNLIRADLCERLDIRNGLQRVFNAYIDAPTIPRVKTSARAYRLRLQCEGTGWTEGDFAVVDYGHYEVVLGSPWLLENRIDYLSASSSHPRPRLHFLTEQEMVVLEGHRRRLYNLGLREPAATLPDYAEHHLSYHADRQPPAAPHTVRATVEVDDLEVRVADEVPERLPPPTDLVISWGTLKVRAFSLDIIATIDPGSRLNAVHERIWRHSRLPLTITYNDNTHDFNGQRILGVIFDAPVLVGGTSTIASLGVVRDLEADLILGAAWISRNGIAVSSEGSHRLRLLFDDLHTIVVLGDSARNIRSLSEAIPDSQLEQEGSSSRETPSQRDRLDDRTHAIDLIRRVSSPDRTAARAAGRLWTFWTGDIAQPQLIEPCDLSAPLPRPERWATYRVQAYGRELTAVIDPGLTYSAVHFDIWSLCSFSSAPELSSVVAIRSDSEQRELCENIDPKATIRLHDGPLTRTQVYISHHLPCSLVLGAPWLIDNQLLLIPQSNRRLILRDLNSSRLFELERQHYLVRDEFGAKYTAPLGPDWAIYNEGPENLSITSTISSYDLYTLPPTPPTDNVMGSDSAFPAPRNGSEDQGAPLPSGTNLDEDAPLGTDSPRLRPPPSQSSSTTYDLRSSTPTTDEGASRILHSNHADTRPPLSILIPQNSNPIPSVSDTLGTDFLPSPVVAVDKDSPRDDITSPVHTSLRDHDGSMSISPPPQSPEEPGSAQHPKKGYWADFEDFSEPTEEPAWGENSQYPQFSQESTESTHCQVHSSRGVLGANDVSVARESDSLRDPDTASSGNAELPTIPPPDSSLPLSFFAAGPVVSPIEERPFSFFAARTNPPVAPENAAAISTRPTLRRLSMVSQFVALPSELARDPTHVPLPCHFCGAPISPSLICRTSKDFYSAADKRKLLPALLPQDNTPFEQARALAARRLRERSYSGAAAYALCARRSTWITTASPWQVYASDEAAESFTHPLSPPLSPSASGVERSRPLSATEGCQCCGKIVCPHYEYYLEVRNWCYENRRSECLCGYCSDADSDDSLPSLEDYSIPTSAAPSFTDDGQDYSPISTFGSTLPSPRSQNESETWELADSVSEEAKGADSPPLPTAEESFVMITPPIQPQPPLGTENTKRGFGNALREPEISPSKLYPSLRRLLLGKTRATPPKLRKRRTRVAQPSPLRKRIDIMDSPEPAMSPSTEDQDYRSTYLFHEILTYEGDLREGEDSRGKFVNYYFDDESHPPSAPKLDQEGEIPRGYGFIRLYFDSPYFRSAQSEFTSPTSSPPS